VYIYGQILTALFNLKINGTLIISTTLLHHIQNSNSLFTLLMTLFKYYNISRLKNSDYIYQYTYFYKFYNFKGINERTLQEISTLLLNNNDKDFDISHIINIKNKNIMKGKFLEYNILSEASKYNFFMEQSIKYFKNEPVNFLNFIGKLTMNRIFLINNDIIKLKVTYDLKSIKNIINDYQNSICCFKDYYRNIEQKLNRHDILDLEKNLQTINRKYSFDFISKLIFNIDLSKQITNNCSNKKLNDTQNALIDNNTNKQLLVDVIIQNLIKNTNKSVNDYIFDSLLFVEHFEILNNYIPSLKKISDDGFNHLYLGQMTPQFLYSFDYFIENKMSQLSQSSNINIYTDLTNFKTTNIKFNILNSNKINDKPIHFIACDDILDMVINGYDIKTIERYNDDTFASSFDIIDDKEKENISTKIKEFEYHEFYKLWMVTSRLSLNGDCCIKHLALPLNSYLYYNGHQAITSFFVNYLYIYLHLFDKITLFKPSVTSNKSLEFYVIGTKFRGIDNKLKDKLLKTIDNFELHQTFFKKEDINPLFVKEVETFMEFMTNRYIDLEDIVTLLKRDLLNPQSNDNTIIKKNDIVNKFLNKSLLNKELTTNIYDIWIQNNMNLYTVSLKKLYYFTKFDIPDINKITFDFNIFEKILDRHDFIKMNSKYDAKDSHNTVCFIHTYLPRKNFSVPKDTMLINMLDDYTLAYKDKLYQLCNDYNASLTKKYFMETYLLNKNDDITQYSHLFNNKRPWYIKIVKEFAGKGNYVISSFDEFKELINNLKNTKKTFKKGQIVSQTDDNLIINKYLESPLLFDKKKFHIRILYIVYVNSKNVINSFISKYGFIWTAKENYNNDPRFYQDPKIHDSHSSSTKTDYLFPNDFEKEFGKKNTEIVSDKILNIFQLISKAQINNISTFPNSKNGYNILGADLLVDKDFNVKILELNNRTGLYTKKKDTNTFISNYLYGNIYNEIISDVFNLEKMKGIEPFIHILV
jgi:hypothetical protein